MGENDPEPHGENGMDNQEHEKTYRFFTSLALWGTATVATILVLMAIFLL